MFPIVFVTSRRIFKYYTGFSFFIFIWVSRLEKNQVSLLRHEKIHFQQQLELLFVFHWLLYALFYAISRYKRHRHYIAYRYNPFELEAYRHDEDENYLKNRKRFAWIKYIQPFRETLSKDMTKAIPKNKVVTL